MLFKAVAALLISTVVAFPSSPAGNFSLPAPSNISASSNVGKAFVHLFEWSWTDIAQECEDFLGPKGYDAVQISPPMEHISGPQWWTRYQPTSYKLVSRSGNREQLIDMVKRCKQAGVSVYADTVFNHIAAGSGTGIDGTAYGNRAIPGIYSTNDFHHNSGDNSKNCAVSDYSNIDNVQHCDLVGLPDLDTSSAYVQQTIGDYLQDLGSIGVEGFRVDASKHQHADNLGKVLAKGPAIFAFHEVISGANEAVKPEMYFGLGQVTEFQFARVLAPNVLGSGKMGYLKTFGEGWGLMPSEHAVTFLDNHDTQRGEAQLTYKNGDLYKLANVFMLAHPYGHPKVMSSYAFNDHDQGPPSDAVHSGSNVNCGNGAWVCEHRWPEVAGMVNFRKVSGDAKVVNFVSDLGNDAIAFGREGKGFVVINRSSQTWSKTFQTGLPSGDHVDILGSQTKVTVGSDGSATLSVPAMSAIAII